MSVYQSEKRRGTIGAQRTARRRLAAAAATAVSVGGGWLTLRPEPARAGNTYVWQNTGGAFGNPTDPSYNNSSNWFDQSTGVSDNVPGANDFAEIVNGQTATINPGDSLATSTLYVGWNNNGTAENGYVSQTGGTFNISQYLVINEAGAPDGLPSEYDISGGTLNGFGSLIQLAGSSTVPDSAVMNISGNAVVNAMGAASDAGVSSLTVGDVASVNGGGYGHLYLSGTATLNVTNLAYIGVNTNSIGIMDMSGGTFNLSGGSNGSSGGLRIGGIATATGTLNMTGGVLNSATTGFTFVAYQGGTGTFNLGGGAANLAGPLAIGGDSGAKGTLNMTGGTLTSTATVPSYVSYQTATGTFNLSGGTASFSGELQVGGSDVNGTYTGNGYLNISNASGGAPTLNVNALTVGRGNNNQNLESGYVTLSAGTVNVATNAILGYAGMGTGSLNVSGGTFNVGTGAVAGQLLELGVFDTAKSVLTLSGGAINMLNGSSIKFSESGGTGGAGNTGGNVVNQTGGTVTFYSNAAGTTVGGTGVLDMEQDSTPGTSDTWNLDGGSLTVPQIVTRNTIGTRNFNFSGGVLRAAGNSTAFMAAGVASAANVQVGGAYIDANGFNISVGQVLQHDSNLGSTADGGLSLNSSTGTGVLVLTGANTYTGPTTIGPNATLQLGDGTTGDDGTIASTSGVTDNGTLAFNRFASASVGYSITGNGAVTKLGAGTQILTSSNSYTGATTVTAGTLALSGTGSINGSSGISVASGATFLQLSSIASSPAITVAGTLNGVGTVGATTVSSGGVVNNGNGSTGVLNLSSLNYLGTATDNLNVASNVSAGLNVLNALTVSGSGPITLNVQLNGGRFAPGVYELIQYGSISSNVTNATVNGLFTLGTGLVTRSQTGSFSLVNNDLDLTVGGSALSGLDVWTGSVNNAWDTATTNFTDATYGGAIAFTPGDAVTFDDTGLAAGNTNPVNISSGTVLPLSVTFNNSSATPYTLVANGSAGIGNYSAVTPTTLTVNGTGTVTLAVSNTYSGGTFVNNGILNATVAGALGTGPVTVAGGTLNDNVASTSSALVTVSGGTLNVNAASALGTGPVTVSGGTLNANFSSGSSAVVSLSAGTLNVNAAAALGTGRLNLSGGALGNTTGSTVQISTNNPQSWNGNFGFSGPSQLNMGTGAVTLNTSPIITLTGTSVLQEGGVVANSSGGAYGLTLNGSTGSQLVMSGLSTFVGPITVNGGTYNATNGTSATTSGSFGSPSLAGRTVTINNGGTVALTNGNELGPGASTPALTFIVNAGGVLETAAATNNNVFGPIILNGGTFATGLGFSAAYPSANFAGTVTVTGSTQSQYSPQYGSVITTNVTNSLANGASLVAGGITFNVSSTGATVADLDVRIPLTNYNGGAGTLIKTGAGTMQLDSASNNYLGSTTVNAGTLVVAPNAAITTTNGVTVSGGALNVIGTSTAGGTVTTTGNALASGGTFNVSNYGTLSVASGKQFLIGTGAGVSGATYQGGLVESNYTAIGETAAAPVTANLSGYYSMGLGANLTGAGGTNGDQEVDVGGYYASSGTFAELDMAAGSTINLATVNPFLFVDRAYSGTGVTGVMNIGGTVQIYNSSSVANAAGLGLVVAYQNLGGDTSTITMMPGGKFLTPTLTVKLNGQGTANGSATDVSVLNLNGGTFQTLGFGGAANQTTTTGYGNTAAVVNFNGGTLQAGNASNTTFLTGLGSVNVYASGGTIDNNGQAITIGQAITSPTGYGVSTVAVSGGAGYLVPPKVTFTGGGGTGATGYATLNGSNGSVSGIVITNPGTGYNSAGPSVTLTTPTGVVIGTAATPGTLTTAPNTGGTLTFQGAGTTTLTGANTYTGGTAIIAGTVRVTGTNTVTARNNGTTGTGDVVVSGTGILGGTGTAGNTSTGAGAALGTGVVTINAGGTITAGASATATGTLTTGVESWNSSTGQYLAKVIDASNTSTGTAGNDRLVMSGLTITSGFNVNISTSTVSSLSTGKVLVLANDTESATTNPFNTSGGVAPAGLTLEVNGSTTTAANDNLALGTQADSLGNGGFDLVLEAAATPEPTSLLLVGMVAAPLALGRRRRRAGAAQVG